MKRNISQAEFIANFEAAMRAQEPVTPRAKKPAAMNALKHGFAGLTVLIPEHEVEAYKKHFAAFRTEYNPVGPTEEFMVHSMAGFSFASEQIRVITTNRINMMGCRPVPNSNESHTPETEHASARAFSTGELAPNLGNLSIYEQRKMRLFQTTRKELLQIQSERKFREKQELQDAAKLRAADLKTRQTHEKEWEPSENGFVCSIVQIDQYLAAEKRRDSILQRVA